jgi:hypothetical protein
LPEYVVTPEAATPLPAPALLEGLHRRGFPVEIVIKGAADQWESIRFTEPGPKEVECSLIRDTASGRLTVTTASDATPEAVDLQAHLVGLLLDELGGQADNSYTRERFNAQEFARKLRHHHAPRGGFREIAWLVFSWIVVALGVALYFSVPDHLKPVDLVVVIIAFLSAVGFTYTHFRT